MTIFSISPVEMVRSPWRNRGLIKLLIQREVTGRYRGSLLGLVWSFFHPLLMLATYRYTRIQPRGSFRREQPSTLDNHIRWDHNF